tara:strand:+ start:1865 stop:2800 length:936 start_codon:yes stop_codon:yes gene_type:complete
MASTYTSNIRLELQADGENPNNWGTILNQNVIDLIDEAITSYTTVALTGANVTLTAINGTTDQSRSPFLEFTGGLTEDVNVIIPAVPKSYYINNKATQASAGTDITVKTASGAGVNIPVGSRIAVICDGVSVFSAINPNAFGFGTAASANIGTGNTDVPDVSIADVRYSQLAAANAFTNTNSFASATTFNGLSSFTSTTTFKQVDSPIVTLTDAASVAVNFNTGNHFLVSLAGNRTLENPTNGKVGQVGHIYIVQDGTGNRTLSYGDMYNFPSGTAPVLTSVSGSVDLLVFSQRATSVLDAVIIKDFKVPA